MFSVCQPVNNVLLYFYPKDFTGGCTKEACGLRDRMGELQTNNVEVLGVSFDSADSHKKFIAQYNLNFTLLADPDGKIVDLYDVKMPMMKMAKRVSFLIGTDGKIVHVTDAMSPQTHFDEMQAAIAGLRDFAIWARMILWESSAVWGVAVWPVPMAQTGS